VEVLTGMELDEGQGARPLAASAWEDRRARLEREGFGDPPVGE